MRPVLVRGIHLAVLWALAVAQPIFDLVGRNAEFLVAHGNTSGDIVLLALVLTLVPPAVLCGIEAAATALSPALGTTLHYVFVGVLAGVLALYVAGRLGLDAHTAVMFGAAGIAGVGAAVAYARYSAPSMVLTALAPVPLVFAAIFLFASPVHTLVLPEDTSAAHAAGGTKTPVVLLVLDEFPLDSLLTERGRIDAHRFPNFAALAHDATWYRNAFATASATNYAVPALLTGIRPQRDDLPVASDQPNSIFSLLSRTHVPVVSETVTDLCDECSSTNEESTGDRLRSLASDLSVAYLHLVAPEDVRRSLPPVDRSWKDFRREAPARDADAPSAAPDDLVAAFSRVLARIGAVAHGDRPPFVMAHVLLPHEPWQYLPSGEGYQLQGETVPGLFEDRWARDPWFTEQGAQRHLLQVGFADRVLGRLLSRLRETGLYQRAAVAVVADHGAAFIPGEHQRRINSANFGQIAPVPMLVKGPGQQHGRVEERPVQTLDLVPILAAKLGIDIPYHVDGKPLREGSPGRRRIVVMDDRGETVAMDSVAIERQSRRFLAMLQRLFGSGRWSSVYEFGPNAALIGKAVPPHAIPHAPGAELAGLESLMRPAGRGTVPAYVSGQASHAAPREPLALALDGRVVAVSQVVREQGESRFGFVIDPRFLSRPARRVEVFAVRAGRLVALARFGSARYAFRRLGGRDFVVAGGRRIPVRAQGLNGTVDGVAGAGAFVRIHGWSADTDKLRPATQILVVSGGRTAVTGLTAARRDDLADYFGEPLRYAGYQLDVPRRALAGCQARVIAVLGNRATELPWNPAAKPSLRALACPPDR